MICGQDHTPATRVAALVGHSPASSGAAPAPAPAPAALPGVDASALSGRSSVKIGRFTVITEPCTLTDPRSRCAVPCRSRRGQRATTRSSANGRTTACCGTEQQPPMRKQTRLDVMDSPEHSSELCAGSCRDDALVTAAAITRPNAVSASPNQRRRVRFSEADCHAVDMDMARSLLAGAAGLLPRPHIQRTYSRGRFRVHEAVLLLGTGSGGGTGDNASALEPLARSMSVQELPTSLLNFHSSDAGMGGSSSKQYPCAVCRACTGGGGGSGVAASSAQASALSLAAAAGVGAQIPSWAAAAAAMPLVTGTCARCCSCSGGGGGGRPNCSGGADDECLVMTLSDDFVQYGAAPTASAADVSAQAAASTAARRAPPPPPPLATAAAIRMPSTSESEQTAATTAPAATKDPTGATTNAATATATSGGGRRTTTPHRNSSVSYFRRGRFLVQTSYVA
jgi:hypothetical protein